MATETVLKKSDEVTYELLAFAGVTMPLNCSAADIKLIYAAELKVVTASGFMRNKCLYINCHNIRSMMKETDVLPQVPQFSNECTVGHFSSV